MSDRAIDPAIGTKQAAAYDRRTAGRLTLKDEQLRAVSARNRLIALSAGAGSGKTTVLVERFLHLVDNDGVSPLDILAITFTEKAASEMKGRIVRRFEERGDELNRRHSEAAYISTIHGFCARLLRENPLAAGIDPAFGIVDDMRRGIFLDEEHERILQDPWFLSIRGLFSARYGSGEDAAFELVTDCALKPREFGKGESPEQSFGIEEHVDAAMLRLDAYCAELWRVATTTLQAAGATTENAAVSGPRSIEQHKRMYEMVQMLPAIAVPDAEWAREFCECTGFTRGVKDLSVRAAIKAVLDVARPLLKTFGGVDRAAQEAIEREQIAPLKVGLYRHAAGLRQRYDRMKLEQSLLDFEDLHRLALRLLDNPAVRSEYAARFRHVLLDEAQDTNPIQKELVDAITSDDGQCCFAVGDIKQSVYGFRGADTTIFREMCRAAGAEQLTLQDNYRSRAEIVGFVNAVGSRLWDGDESVDYVPLVSQLAYTTGADANARVELMLVEQRDADPDSGRDRADDSAAVHEREAFAIAQRIQQMVGDTGSASSLTVYDRHAKEYRQARYSDIAILAVQRSNFPIYERVLGQLGIPAVADGGRGFFGGREVQDLLAALRVVANPYDEVSLLAALRSPLFGWSDEDLVRLRVAGPWDMWQACVRGFVPTGESADVTACETLGSLRRLAESLPPARLLHWLLERTAYVAALMRTTRGRTGAANVQKLIEFARQSAEVDGPGLQRFIRRAELAESYLGNERDASVAADGEDVVLLGTIHGSKGLEWPIVVLAGLDADFARSDTGSFYSSADGVLVLNPRGEDDKTVKPASQLLVAKAQKERDVQEARRILYVGMTRAREQLILSGGCRLKAQGDTATSAGSAAQNPFGVPMKWLCDAASVTSDVSDGCDVSIGEASLRVRLAAEASVAHLRALSAPDDSQLALARSRVARMQLVAWQPTDQETPTAIKAAPAVAVPFKPVISAATVTQLVYFARCPMVYYLNLVLQIEEHPRKRRQSEVAGERRYSAAELGSMVHEMLERADFSAVPTAEARRLLDESANAEMQRGDRDRTERVLASTLSDPLIDRARHAVRIEREYPFYMNVDGTLVHGVIDLVFTDADGRGVVVDYKSNDLSAPDRVNVLAKYYEPQILMYALAARKAGVARVDEATLYFLNKAVAHTFIVDDARLEAAEQQMSDALGRISRAEWTTEPGEKCRRCGYRKRGFCEVGKRFVE